MIRALDTWLLLKHDTQTGMIQQWNNQKAWLLKLCKCSDAIFRHRIKLLEQMKLLSFYKIERKRDSLQLCSWETLAKIFSIEIKKKLIIQYNVNDKQTLHQWLIAAEIEDNKNRQDYAIARKLGANAEAKKALDAAIIHAGADRSKMNDLQYYLMWMRILYTSDFNRLSMAHDELIAIRPDNNRSVRGIAKAWNKPRGAISDEEEEKIIRRLMVRVSYWKKKLKANGIIDYHSLQVESQERVRNKECKVLWLKNKKKTLLCLCDQIEILKPWLLGDTSEFKKLLAA